MAWRLVLSEMYGGSSYSSLGKYLKRTFSPNQQDGSCCLWTPLSLAVLPAPVKREDLLSCSCANCVEQNHKNDSLGAGVAKQGHAVLSMDSCGGVGRAQFLAESAVSWK